MIKIVIAGATGYVGGNVARACVSSGLFDVRVLTRDVKRIPHDLVGKVEPFVAEVTQPETLRGLCDGVDVIFSSIGMYIVNRKPSLWEVDYHGNLALLDEARRARVNTFAFVSVLRGPEMAAVSPVAEIREGVAAAIRASGLDYLIYQPTGFYNDIGYLLRSARQRGVLYVAGNPNVRINPLHGLDFGEEVARMIAAGNQRNALVPIGGPEIFTREEMARLAFKTLGLPPKIRYMPLKMVSLMADAARFVGHENAYTLFKFLEFAFSTPDMTGPCVGSRRLGDFFARLAREQSLALRPSLVEEEPEAQTPPTL